MSTTSARNAAADSHRRAVRTDSDMGRLRVEDRECERRFNPVIVSNRTGRNNGFPHSFPTPLIFRFHSRMDTMPVPVSLNS